jgi:hypothetical protein
MRGVRNVDELDRLKRKNEICGFDDVKDHVKFFESHEDAENYRIETYNKVKMCGYKKRIEYIKSK